LTIKVKAAFPVEWGREYYTVDEKKKERCALCTCCGSTGKATIKGIYASALAVPEAMTRWQLG